MAAVPGVVHGFFGTQGGVSEGAFSTLNGGFSQGDRAEHVLENRRRVMALLGFPQAPLLTLQQVHGTHVERVTAGWSSPHQSPVADGMVTCVPELALGILTADCGPVLFADTQKRIIGACHAGWRGAFAGILEKTVEALEALGSNREELVASLGPTIAQECYEVDAAFYQNFLKKEKGNEIFFKTAEKKGHFFFDLPGFIKKELDILCLKSVHILGQNTYTGPFFSRRKMLKNNASTYGCSLSVIMLSYA